MELENFRSDWQRMDTPSISHEQLHNMIRENRHPVIKQIQWQLLIETVGWGIFLIVYYDFFDGDQRPFYSNLLLVLGAVLLLLHHGISYWASRNIAGGTDVKRSLENYLRKMHLAAKTDVLIRVMAVAALLLFFTGGITLTFNKYGLIVILVLLTAFQIRMLYKVWMRKINKLKKVLEELAA